ncbi:MAG: isoaspartyl peptidase/L-asparaginase [Sulfolobaceae archaeon]|nr:isoaspartyl peptidase/L-asparaginase [Sulfolobaceae archaeon]
MKYTLPVLLVHGGAGNWTKDREEAGKKGILDALKAGYEQFKSGSAVEAVVEAIASMEDSGIFDAGVGSVKNSEGEVEMDAGIMHGNTLDVGAVAAVRVKNPIRLALKVMKMKRHVLMVGSEAERVLTKNPVISSDTVGAVALDTSGNIVAGTSTGGIAGKLPGRVGDSPIPGAGYYATQYAAISSTGIGELILRILPAKEVEMLVRLGFNIEDALRIVVNRMTNIFGKGNIGMIGIDSKGNAGASYNTIGMARGIIWGDGREYKVYVFEGEI